MLAEAGKGRRQKKASFLLKIKAPKNLDDEKARGTIHSKLIHILLEC